VLTRNRVCWGGFPVLFAAVVTLIGLATPAYASELGLYAADGDIAHSCKVIGSADGYQAVVCADIITGLYNSDEYYARGQIEVYCQTDSGTTVECANIYAEGVFSDGGGDLDDVGSYACGHSFGPCPSGREIIREGEYIFLDNNVCADGGYSDVWTVVYGGNTQIELPKSDETIELDASNGNDGINYSSGHYLACF